MGHCKHQWQECTDTLREVFTNGERSKHAFYVCGRCLKIDEVMSPPITLERPVAAAAWAHESKRDAA